MALSSRDSRVQFPSLGLAKHNLSCPADICQMHASALVNEGASGTWSHDRNSPGPTDLYKTSSLLSDRDRPSSHCSQGVGPYNSERASPNSPGTSEGARPSAPVYAKHLGRQPEVKVAGTGTSSSKGYEDLSWFDLTKGCDNTPKLPCLSNQGLARKAVSCHAELWRVDMDKDEHSPTDRPRPSDWICQQLNEAGNDRTSVSSHTTAASTSPVGDDMRRRRDRQRELCMAVMRVSESEKVEAPSHPQLPLSSPTSTKKRWQHRVTS